MTDELVNERRQARVQIYVDDNPVPIADQALPTRVRLNTFTLPDGAHRVRVRATDVTGKVSVREIPFKVDNGPGLTVTGLAPNSVRHGVIQLGVNAFSADEPFEPERAETHSSIPVWVWVLMLVIVGWAGWYGQSMWNPPAQFATSPTYHVYSAPPRAFGGVPVTIRYLGRQQKTGVAAGFLLTHRMVRVVSSRRGEWRRRQSAA
ncbi:MAG: cytochrome C [Gammaproteobacteria bacterium]